MYNQYIIEKLHGFIFRALINKTKEGGGGGGVRKNLILLSFDILNSILSIVLLQTPQFHYCATIENLKHLRP